MLDFNLRKTYPGVSLEVAAEIGPEWLVLLAPSGAGKSLTLNMIAGLVRPDAGHVRIEGQVLYDSAARVHVPIRHRRIGYAFQHYALFPHMRLAANIAYGIPRELDATREVARWLRFFHLEDKADAFPRELSGGQQQRAALARTLASAPRVLLLDEPLSALDPHIRDELQRELAVLKSELSIPVVLVTHDFQEAQLLGDRMIVLDEGRMVEEGPNAELFARPRRHETARFLGVENVISARITRVSGGEAQVDAGGWRIRAGGQDGLKVGDAVYCCVRAADVRLVVDKKRRPNRIKARVTRVAPLAGTNRLTLESPEVKSPLIVGVDDYVLERYSIVEGGEVTVWLPPHKVFLCR